MPFVPACDAHGGHLDRLELTAQWGVPWHGAHVGPRQTACHEDAWMELGNSKVVGRRRDSAALRSPDSDRMLTWV
jgi:hypothetical protein